MTRFRRALGGQVIAWLLCQTAALTCAPAALWVNVPAAVDECTCVHGEHAICPMHHKPQQGVRLCLLGTPDNGDTAVLGSLLGVVGLVPASDSPVAPARTHAVVRVETDTLSLRPAPPDPPPPRV